MPTILAHSVLAVVLAYLFKHIEVSPINHIQSVRILSCIPSGLTGLQPGHEKMFYTTILGYSTERQLVTHVDVIIEWIKWETVAQNLRESKVGCSVESSPPGFRDKRVNKPPFFCDSGGNAIKIKAFRNQADGFRK